MTNGGNTKGRLPGQKAAFVSPGRDSCGGWPATTRAASSPLLRHSRPELFVDVFGGSGAFTLAALEQGWPTVYNDVHPGLVQYMRIMQTSHHDEVLDLALKLDKLLDPEGLLWLDQRLPLARPVLQAALFLLVAHNVEGRNMRARKVTHLLPMRTATYQQLRQKAERFREAAVCGDDFADIIRQYDSPNTFFFVDPPWFGSDGLYEYTIAGRYEELSTLLLNCRGRYAWTQSSTREGLTFAKDHAHLNWWIARQQGVTFRQLLATNFELLHPDPINPAEFGL